MNIPRLTPIALAVLLASGASSISRAQSPRPLAPARAGSQAANRTVTLDVVVTHKQGKDRPAVSGLRKQDFGLVDEGQPVAVTSFREITGAQQPVRAIVVVDELNIRVTGQEYVRDEVDRFLKHTTLTVPMELAIVTDKGIQMQEGFSTDGPGMAAQLEKQGGSIRSIPQSAGFYGAAERMEISLRSLDAIITRASTLPGRTLVLWVSPGWPILSGPEVDLSRKQQQAIFDRVIALSTGMRQARVTLYAIDPLGAQESLVRSDYFESYLKPVTKPTEVDLGDEALQVLAIQSGGLYLNSTGVIGMLQQSLADSQDYYELTFPMAPVEKPNTFRSIYLKVPDTGMTVRTRNGYYAQP